MDPLDDFSRPSSSLSNYSESPCCPPRPASPSFVSALQPPLPGLGTSCEDDGGEMDVERAQGEEQGGSGRAEEEQEYDEEEEAISESGGGMSGAFDEGETCREDATDEPNGTSFVEIEEDEERTDRCLKEETPKPAPALVTLKTTYELNEAYRSGVTLDDRKLHGTWRLPFGSHPVEPHHIVYRYLLPLPIRSIGQLLLEQSGRHLHNIRKLSVLSHLFVAREPHNSHHRFVVEFVGSKKAIITAVDQLIRLVYGLRDEVWTPGEQNRLLDRTWCRFDDSRLAVLKGYVLRDWAVDPNLLPQEPFGREGPPGSRRYEEKPFSNGKNTFSQDQAPYPCLLTPP
ncbi:hypothetical protein JCM8547_003668 [Rhodosporidiobolus lusitaniae]